MTETTLAAGRFFGNGGIRHETTSFTFLELDATVPDREVPRHTHEAPHFVLVLRGIYVTEARNQQGLCPPGTLIYNPGGTTHRDRFCSEHGRFLSITPKAMPDRGSPVPLLLHDPLEKLTPLHSIVEQLIRQPAESLGLELIGAVAGTPDASANIPSWLTRAREYIDDTLQDRLSIAAVAKAADVHPVSLARAFRRAFGCSPGEYQRRARLSRLRNILADNTPLADAALDCGYNDQSQMTRAFTATFGTSPARFRTMVKASNRQEIKAGTR